MIVEQPGPSSGPRGDRAPRTILCCHEEISVALAHGYAKATGRPMVAALHDVVGLQHACMAIYNAWVDRVPVLLLGGTGPVDSTLRRPWIEWIHTALVQGNLIRDFVKFDVTLQEQRVAEALPIPQVDRYVASTRLQADSVALEQVADWLVAAERP